MLRGSLCALTLVVSLAGCSSEVAQPRDPVQLDGKAFGPELPAVRPYELNGPRTLAGWSRDPELERSADFTRLASALPQSLRARLTGVRAGYYRLPGSDRVLDRFFYAGGTLGGGDPEAVAQEVIAYANGYRRRTVTAADATFGDPAVKRVYVSFGLAAFQNPYQVGKAAPASYNSVVWTDGKTLGVVTMESPNLSDVLGKSKQIRADLG
ncbi:hypothetical protein [Actinomadura rugatobispora]|uniref:Lipoprotein n=1 Tax=Actinomadura rugatobispora TaxID=1994 RepID=A0ABW1AF78_9ACTN|nr:hypothetical protein GCM10010200_078060 [Actinomadura rugatobispora]